MFGKLFVVATPIGNLADISGRALAVLTSCHQVICEDKRVTQKLLSFYNISKPLMTFNQHTDVSRAGLIINEIKNGHDFCYVTDAGTPGISDPGGKLVEICVEEGITVVPIPGASALATAISVAGINLQEFIFLGFPPHKKGRQTFFKNMVDSKLPVIFYESTHRVLKALSEIDKLAPDRQVIVMRELTKKFETIYRGSASDIIEKLGETSTKGEFVVIVNIEK